MDQGGQWYSAKKEKYLLQIDGNKCKQLKLLLEIAWVNLTGKDWQKNVVTFFGTSIDVNRGKCSSLEI